MTVTFCGHAQISQSEKIEKWLYDVTQKLIEQGATTFYLGGYAQLLEEKKKTYAEYRRSREEMRELLAAKANVDRLMSMEEEKQEDKDHEHARTIKNKIQAVIEDQLFEKFLKNGEDQSIVTEEGA